MVQDESGNRPDVAAAQRWADDQSLSWLMAADTEGSWLSTWGNSNDEQTFVQHSYTIVGSNGRVAWRRDGNDSATADAIIDALGSID